MKLTTRILENEYWWGGAIHHGDRMPLHAGSTYSVDLSLDAAGNQSAPFFISTAGRYIWSELPFAITFAAGDITAQGPGEIELCTGCGTLAQTYRSAQAKHFAPDGMPPQPLFYTRPQYNTWAELTYNQCQQSVLAYARAAVENGYSTGVLMIDASWQVNYGAWRFDPVRFPNPKQMVGQLHALGFKVMLWVCPYLSPDSAEFRELWRDTAHLIRTPQGKPALVEWWDGYSAALDMTKPADREWMRSQLADLMQNFGVDGFKFDGGGLENYTNFINARFDVPNLYTQAWNTFAKEYEFSEVKDTWKAGGLSFNQRERDKRHCWGEDGLACLIPDAIALSLMGSSFICPDMVGGGEWTCFIGGAKMDEELIVRFAQASALFPAMQLSVAPWRILSAQNNAYVRQAQQLHTQLGQEIYALVAQSAKTGEPVMRPLAYNYPHGGFETVTDQFMLGNDILVAPVLQKGAVSRTVVFPRGCWQDSSGNRYTQGSQTVAAPLSALPWFRKV